MKNIESHDENLVLIVRHDPDQAEAITDAGLDAAFMGFAPAFAAVIGTIDFATDTLVVAEDIQNLRIGGRDGDAHPANLLAGRESLGQEFPRLARVGRFVDSAAGAGVHIVPRLPVAFPCNGIQRLVVRRIHDDLDNTDLLGDIEDLLPRLAAVGGLEDTALFVVGVLMTERSDIHDVIILRVDDDATDVVSVVEAHVLPCAPRVSRLEHARAGIRTTRHHRLAGADPDQIRILVGYRYHCDRERRLALKDWLPSRAVVDRFPEVSGPGAAVERRLPLLHRPHALNPSALDPGANSGPLDILEYRRFSQLHVVIPGLHAHFGRRRRIELHLGREA